MIETERLLLRTWRIEDIPSFMALTNTSKVMEHMGGIRTPTEIEDIIIRQIAMQASFGLSMWAMEERVTGELIGSCGLRYGGHVGTPVSDELEIGWRVAEAYWGKGYACEAASASIIWGWKNTARPRISAWTVQSNRPSWGLMIRLGMTRRPDLDFDHPRFEASHPLRRHITYAIERPPLAR